MKKYEITEEQIKKLDVLLITTHLQEWYPEVFETKIKNGWYKHKNNEFKKWLVYQNFDTDEIYGFNIDGEWSNRTTKDYIKQYCEPASESEVLEALKNEFEKQNPNIRFNCYYYCADNNSFIGWNNDIDGRIRLFIDGIFTKFYTQEEAEKLLNGKII